MNCATCGFGHREGDKFCGKCKAELLRLCARCKRENPPENLFCDACGSTLEEIEGLPPVDYSQPHSYTPKHPPDKILTTRSAIEGEREVVTVLLADVADPALGYSRLGNLDAEHLEVAVRARRSPQGIVAGRPAAESSDLRRAGWPTATGPPGLPPLNQPKVLAMRFHQGVRLEDRQRLEKAGAQAIEPDPEYAIPKPKPEPFRSSAFPHRPLLAQREDFQMEPSAATTEAGEVCKQREKERFHACGPTMAAAERPMKSRSAEFLAEPFVPIRPLKNEGKA